MDFSTSNFRYSTTLSRSQPIEHEILEVFPNLSEISFQSRIFTKYNESVKSCKRLMEDLCKGVNMGFEEPRFKVGAEVNPEHTGTPTLSKDWGDDEVARFWLYDRSQEGNGKAINAVCKASIFAIPQEPSEARLN